MHFLEFIPGRIYLIQNDQQSPWDPDTHMENWSELLGFWYGEPILLGFPEKKAQRWLRAVTNQTG